MPLMAHPFPAVARKGGRFLKRLKLQGKNLKRGND
jgi:hypothetical protein